MQDIVKWKAAHMHGAEFMCLTRRLALILLWLLLLFFKEILVAFCLQLGLGVFKLERLFSFPETQSTFSSVIWLPSVILPVKEVKA